LRAVASPVRPQLLPADCLPLPASAGLYLPADRSRPRRGAMAAGEDDSALVSSRAEDPPPSGGAAFTVLPAEAPLGWAALAFLAAVFLLVPVAVASTSTRPLRSLVGYFVALAPSVACFALIVYRLRDPVVSKGFLLGSVFINAVPGLVVVTIVELFVAVVGLAVVFGDQLQQLAREYSDGLDKLTAGLGDGTELTPEQKAALKEAGQALWDRLKAEIPLWKVIATVLLMAFAVAAFTEEMAKYLVGRRYRKLLDSGIGVRGVVACAAASALGLAGVEHVMYAGSYVMHMGFGSALFEGVVRSLFAFPLHVGTTFWLGTRMARFAVLKEPVAFGKSIAVPIVFHGALDAFAFFAAAEENSLPLLGYLAYPFNTVLIGTLLVMCRREFNKVIEREAQILDAEEEDRGRSFAGLSDSSV
jgi:hypothetical protein